MSLVALLTDFGLRDTYVAEVRLALMRHGPPDLRVLDLTHDVPPGDVAAGAWTLRRLWPQLPPGSVALAVVDPGVGTSRPAVAAVAGGRGFVGPGNGLASFLAGGDDLEVALLTEPSPPPGLPASSTFHGRDLFAPAAARLAGGMRPSDLGPPTSARDLGVLPAASGDGARVVWVDRFGNLVTDLARDTDAGRRLDAGAALRVGAWTVRGPVGTFADGADGEPVWYWGSGDTLEIAVREDSAAGLLGVSCGLVIALPGP